MDVRNIHILVVDDDENYARALEKQLSELGIVDVAHDEETCRSFFRPYKYDLVLLDVRLREEKEGLDLLEYIIGQDPLSTVMIVSGYGDIATAVDALQRGAKTFLEKDKVSVHEIRIRAEHALKESYFERRLLQLESTQEMEEIVGDDPKIRTLKDLIKLVAQDGETTVLIRGETGTGKELVARAIQRVGVRKDGPFIRVALIEKNVETITSELFGHEKGAFTGALGRHYGFFEQAHKGILFIDEVGDLPIEVQAKLLRVIDQKSFRRMGGNEDITIDVQLVTATNRPLEDMVKEGSFREDLYYRLKVFEIYLSPLRERKGDISLLANYFLQKLVQKGKTTAKAFAVDALDMMSYYRWPGNVRELQSIVVNAALRSKLEGKAKITAQQLAQFLLSEKAFSGEQKHDIFYTLAEEELKKVQDALIASGGRKTEAWKLLCYPNRFTMTRRVKKIMAQFPELSEKYPELRRNYGKHQGNTDSR